MQLTPYAAFYEDSAPLLIVFSPFESSIVEKHYKENKLSNINALIGTLKFPGTKYFQNNFKFNVLHVKDDFQSWGLIFYEKILMEIRNIISTICPSTLITYGASAGGFQSLLYGISLNADMAISSSPQTVAFHHYMNNYRYDINDIYAFSIMNYCYIPKIMKLYNNHTRKVIFYSDGNEYDAYHYNLIADIDKLTTGIPFNAGTAHNLFEYYGNEFMHDIIMKYIEECINAK